MPEAASIPQFISDLSLQSPWSRRWRLFDVLHLPGLSSMCKPISSTCRQYPRPYLAGVCCGPVHGHGIGGRVFGLATLVQGVPPPCVEMPMDHLFSPFPQRGADGQPDPQRWATRTLFALLNRPGPSLGAASAATPAVDDPARRPGPENSHSGRSSRPPRAPRTACASPSPCAAIPPAVFCFFFFFFAISGCVKQDWPLLGPAVARSTIPLHVPPPWAGMVRK